MEQKKERKTAASIRRVLTDRLAEEELQLFILQSNVVKSETRIELIQGLIETADANGKEEGNDE